MNILVLILSFISIGLKAATLILIATNNMQKNLWLCWVIIAIDSLECYIIYLLQPIFLQYLVHFPDYAGLLFGLCINEKNSILFNNNKTLMKIFHQRFF